MIMAMQLYGLYSENVIDLIIEGVHACTPLISTPVPGRIFCGLDDIHGLRQLVSKYKLRAAITHSKHEALLLSYGATAGRLDVYENADAVPSSALLHVTELDVSIRDIDRLRMFGLDTIGKLTSLSHVHLVAQFGNRGKMLYNFLHESTDQTLPLYVPPPSVVTAEYFDNEVIEPSQLIEAIEQCLRRACTLLAQRYAWRIDVAVLDKAGNVLKSADRILRNGSNQANQLAVHIHALIRVLTREPIICWGVKLRFASLRAQDSEQISMFTADVRADDIIKSMLPRYTNAMKQITILNPWSIIPEEYAKVSPWSERSKCNNLPPGTYPP